MIRPGFLDRESRQDLIELARDGSAAHRLARRANALVLLDDGMSCEAIAKVLLLDDDTIRTWHRLYEEDGIEGLTSFGYEGSACRLSGAQQDQLKAWIAATLPRTTREIGAWIEKECGIEYEGRSGLIALLHRLGMEHRKPKDGVIGRPACGWLEIWGAALQADGGNEVRVERPQASEGEAQHGPFCWTGRFGQGDERLHCG